MSHETSIRLPARLVGIVRTDAAAPVAVGAPVMASAPVTAAVPVPATAGPSAAENAERNQIRPIVAALAQVPATIQAQHQQLLHAVEPLAIELAIAIAGKFLQQRAEAGTLPLADMVQQAVERLDTRQPATVALHPQDMALVERQAGPLQKLIVNGDVRFAGDASVARGSCRVQTQDRGLHFDLAGRLAALRQQLLDAVDA